jgi:TonB-linked SusC/RagA family outer membrane protein
MNCLPSRLLLVAVLLAGALGSPHRLRAQATGTVTGTITSTAGAPLSGASVAVTGTNLGTQTGADGRYTLTGVQPGVHVVRANQIGYAEQSKSVTVVAGQAATADFQLQAEAVQLEAVVAVGYGTQKKVNLTGAVAAVDLDEVNDLPVPTLTQALQGISPGLQIIDGGGLPGRYSTSLLVRGQGTLGRGGNRGDASAARPLVLIDGLEGDLNSVAVGDVASISVLKDAASAAIYGSRAANGVILITTRRGADSARPRITYSGSVGIEEMTAYPERVSTVQHMELRNLARKNMRDWCTTTANCDPAAYPDTYTQGAIDSTRVGADPVLYPSTDWVDLVYDPGSIQNHSLRVSGGRETARYALSLDYMRQGGLMPNAAADRKSVRLNTDLLPLPRLSAGLDLALSRRWDMAPTSAGRTLFTLVHDTPPTRVGVYPDGTYGYNLFGYNPLAYAKETGDEQRGFNQASVAARVNYDLLPGWLKLSGLGSIRYDNNTFRQFLTDSRYIDTWPASGSPWGPNRLEQRNTQGTQNTLRALLDYGHQFGDSHDWSGVLGYEQIDYDNDEFRAWRQDFFSNDLGALNAGNENTRGNWGTGTNWALRSVFGRMNYSFRSRYLLEANARYDGSSRFAEGRRFGLFPSFSAAWRVSEEPFFNLGFINDLKLRGSWGRLGNQDVPLYSYYSSISIAQPYWFGGQIRQGAAATSLANQALSWETTTATDFGFDAAFLDQRLSVTGDLYWRKTDDILLNVPIPAMVGRAAPFVNAGKVENKGWELEASWRDFVGEVSYNVAFNLSDNRNQVLDLYGTGPYIQGERVVEVGAPINAWYGYESTGFFVNQAEIDAHAQPGGYTTRPGDLIFKDQNGDGVINPDDRVIIGDPNPRYIFGLNVGAKWRNLDVSAFLQGVGKRDQYLALGFIQGPVWENYTSEWHTDYFDPAKNNQGARHPTYYANENRNYYSVNSNWILDGSFAKLRNLQVGYSLPASLTERVGADRMRLYVTGKNLWTYSRLGIGLDPEYSDVVGSYYPQTRVISIGTDLSF